MRKTIEFKPSKNNSIMLNPSKANSFEDLVLKEAYRNYRHRFEVGKTKIRLLPAVAQNGEGNWFLKVPVLQHPNGRHAHPRAISAGAKCVYDFAYEYMKVNHSSRLFNKANKSGLRLLPSPAMACWAIVQDLNGTKLRLLVSSDYDGSRGGAAGFGHILQEFVNRYGSDETVSGHPLNPDDGVSLIIERIGGGDTKFPSYRINLADDRSPLQPILDKVSEIEHNSLIPLEKTIHFMEPEEEWGILAKLIGDDLVSEIRSAQENSKQNESSQVEEPAYHPDDYKDFPAKW